MRSNPPSALLTPQPPPPKNPTHPRTTLSRTPYPAKETSVKSCRLRLVQLALPDHAPAAAFGADSSTTDFWSAGA